MRQRRLAAIWVHCKFASTLADGNVTFFDVPHRLEIKYSKEARSFKYFSLRKL